MTEVEDCRVSIDTGGGRRLHLRFETDDDHIAGVIRKTATFYEAEMLADIRSRLFFAELAVDVGAHVGNHTLYFAHVLGLQTIAFEPNPSGLFVNIPSSAQKHTIERLTLTDDRRRLRYESTVEDPEYLGKPSSFTMLWDYRPDLKPSPRSEACDQKVAARYKEY